MQKWKEVRTKKSVYNKFYINRFKEFWIINKWILLQKRRKIKAHNEDNYNSTPYLQLNGVDHRRKVSHRLPRINTLESEIQALIMAMINCWSKGYRKIIFKGVPIKNVMNLVNRTSSKFAIANWIMKYNTNTQVPT